MLSRFAFAILLFASAAVAQDRGTFENLDKAWIKAVLAKDFTALDKLLAGDLIYGHASNVVDTKSSYIEKIRAGKQVYKTMEQYKVSARVYGDTGVTHSWMRITGVNAQGPFDDKVMLLHVWVKSGNQWRLAAHQTARVDKIPD